MKKLITMLVYSLLSSILFAQITVNNQLYQDGSKLFIIYNIVDNEQNISLQTKYTLSFPEDSIISIKDSYISAFGLLEKIWLIEVDYKSSLGWTKFRYELSKNSYGENPKVLLVCYSKIDDNYLTEDFMYVVEPESITGFESKKSMEQSSKIIPDIFSRSYIGLRYPHWFDLPSLDPNGAYTYTINNNNDKELKLMNKLISELVTLNYIEVN